MRFMILCLAAVAASQHAAAQSVAVSLDAAALVRQLDDQLAPRASRASRTAASSSQASVTLPWFGGDEVKLYVRSASQLAPELQARHPEIRSYRIGGYGEDVHGRLSLTPRGAHGYLHRGGQDYLLTFDPAVGHTLTRVDPLESLNFTCEVTEAKPGRKEILKPRSTAPNACFQQGGTLRRYRMAITNTVEFAQEYGATTTGEVIALFNDRLAELNAIYEPELAITFELIAGNAALVNLDANAAGYPYTDPENRPLALDQSQSHINSLISASDYDIGHGLHAVRIGPGGVSFGGVAQVGVVCDQLGGNPSKARGYSTVLVGEPLVIFQHEVGHQFGAYHTNYGCGSVGGGDGQRYEPGQGVTIMGTSENCAPADEYEGDNDTYFHVGSLQAINDHIASEGGCFTTVTSGNAPPNADATGGNPAAAGAYTIPARTSFTLVAAGSDSDGDALTYNWESYDTDRTASAPPGATAGSTTAPLFRSFEPGPDPQRFFPTLSTILSGVPPDGSSGEILPTVDRPLTFRLTVRDGNGGVACDAITLTVEDTGSPFAITSLNAPTTLTADGTTTETITWDVAGTDAAAFGTPTVDIVLSTDGGKTFSYVIASGVPNDGSETFVVPAFATAKGRIKVQGSGNVFLDVNDANFAIQRTDACAADEARIYPTRDVRATAGDEALDLGLAPLFGTPLSSTFALRIDLDSPSDAPFVGRDGATPDIDGDCEQANFGSRRYAPAFDVSALENFTLKLSVGNTNGDISSSVVLLEAPTGVGPTCGPAFADASITLTETSPNFFSYSPNDLNHEIVAGSRYAISPQTLDESNVVTFDATYSGGTLYSREPQPANTEFTYAIVDETGVIVDFDPDCDLRGYGGGQYVIHGVSLETGEDLSPYVGESYESFVTATGSINLCARASANAVAVTIENSLPVELADLSAEALPAGNRVAWTSAVEVDVASFTVERSGDGAEWEPIGEEAPRGSGSAYATLDADAPAGTSYYRLATRDRDGSLEHSRLVSATRAAPGAAALTGPAVVPNPSAAGTTLALLTPAGQGGDYAVHVADASGRTVYSATRALAAGQRAELPLRLPPGLYLATFARGPERTQTRFTVAR